MTTQAPRIYVTTDPSANVRAIANVADHQYAPSRNELCVSLDGTTFYTVLFNSRQSGPGYYNGTITQPALDIADLTVNFDGDTMALGMVVYELDADATISEIITKPVMRIISIVETHLGLYVTTQDYLTGRSHDFLDGKPLTITDSIRARGDEDDLVENTQYVGHRYVVLGDHMDTTRQTATFDGWPATPCNVDDYEVTVADDLTTVTVTKK